MMKIMITENDIRRISEYKCEKYFSDFIFDEFELITKYDDYKTIIKVDKNNNVNYRLIKRINYIDYQFSFIEDEEYIVCLDSNGKTIGAFHYIEDGISEMLREHNDTNAIQHKLILHIASTIRMVKQYIMNESYKRVTIQKVSNVSKSTCKCEKKAHANGKKTVTYLLNDIVNYVSSNDRSMIYTCECWTVRGHFRHYKNGKVVWVSAYEKGSKRNTGLIHNDRVYSI